MVPIAVDTGGSAPTGHLVSSPAFLAHPAGIFCASPCRERPDLTYRTARLLFGLVLIVTLGRLVVATSRRYAE